MRLDPAKRGKCQDECKIAVNYRSGPCAGPTKRGNSRGHHRRPRFTCKFLGAAPQTPSGTYNVITNGEEAAKGSRHTKQSSVSFFLLALYSWPFPNGVFLCPCRIFLGVRFTGCQMVLTRKLPNQVKNGLSEPGPCNIACLHLFQAHPQQYALAHPVFLFLKSCSHHLPCPIIGIEQRYHHSRKHVSGS